MANDVEILTGILGILLVTAIIMPWIGEAAEVTSVIPEFIIPEEILTNETAMLDFAEIGPVFWFPTQLNFILSLFYAFFFFYPWFPWWLQALHFFIRVIAVVLIYRLIRSGAG
jgi:hypothetical protein